MTKMPPDQDLTKCPNCGGIADNGHDRCFPPNPYYCTKCDGTGNDMPDMIGVDLGSQEQSFVDVIGHIGDATIRVNGVIHHPARIVNSLQEENARLRKCLKSIADNTCCDGCREAGLVAKRVLEEK